MALIRRGAGDRVCSDARASLAAIRLRTGIVVITRGAIGRIGIAAHTRCRIARTCHVALIRRGADDGVCSDARASLAAIHLRTGIAVVACRPIGGLVVRRARSGSPGARFRDVTCTSCSTTNRRRRLELARRRAAVAVRRIAVIALLAGIDGSVATCPDRTVMDDLG